MSESTLFDLLIKESKNRKENRSALTLLMAQADEDKNKADRALMSAIIKTIKSKSSEEFINELKNEISKKHKSVLISGNLSTYLEHLAGVIFYVLSGNSPAIGFEQFIMPGKNYQQGADFFEKYRNDFIVMSRIFQFSMGPVPEITIGYARKIEKA